MYSCVELYVYFKTLIALRVLLVFLYYELGLHSDKFTLTSMEIGILLNINIGHRKDDTLHTSKSEYFKRGNIYYEFFTLKLIKEESQYQRVLIFVIFSTSFR